jgi:2-keto-4-pentenoate hydratase
MTIHNPDNLPEGIIAEAIQMMQDENPKQPLMEITVKTTDKPDEYCISPVYAKVPFQRIRRITGYLVGTTERWNNAKMAELQDRVTHGG